MTGFPREAYRPLEPYAPDRRPIPVDLSDNTNRWGVHPAALAAVREADPEELLRYPPVYADRLRAAVARRFDVPEEAIATGCGSDDLLDSAFRAACDPGRGVRFVPPTFSMIEIFARMNGLEPLPTEGPLPDPERLLEGDPGLVYLCRPNNPTGEVAPRDWIRAVIEAVEPEGPVLLLDEAYVDFVDDEDDHFMREAARSRRVVVLRTLSKVFGLAGLRVGFAVGAPEVVREIEKSRGPYKVNRLAEVAAVAGLADEEGWVAQIRERVREGRSALEAELERRALAPLPSGANFLCIPLGLVPEGELAASAEGLTAALRERGVAVRPFPGLAGIGDAIRVTIGPAHEMERFLAALDEALTITEDSTEDSDG